MQITYELISNTDLAVFQQDVTNKLNSGFRLYDSPGISNGESLGGTGEPIYYQAVINYEEE